MMTKMKKTILLAIMTLMLVILAGMATATTCTVASSMAVIQGSSEDVTVTCSDIGATTDTVTIEPSGFSTSCIQLDSSSKQVTGSNPSTTFEITGVGLACMLNIHGRTITWTFTHSDDSNNIASKSTVVNVLPPQTITPTFSDDNYTVTNGTDNNVSVTLAITTSQSQVDIRNIDIILTTTLNGTINGTENKTDIVIDVSESTTKYITWNLQLPPLPPGMDYDFNVSITSDNARDASATTIINVSNGTGVVSVNISLISGWNLFSTPVDLDNASVGGALSSIDGNYVSVWGFTSGVFQVYYSDPSLSFLNDLTNIVPGKGYWLSMTGADNLLFAGDANTDSVAIVSGWNLVGLNSIDSDGLDVATAMTSIDGSYSSMWGFSSGVFRVYYSDPSLSFLNDLSTLYPGRGFWLYGTATDTWSLS